MRAHTCSKSAGTHRAEKSFYVSGGEFDGVEVRTVTTAESGPGRRLFEGRIDSLKFVRKSIELSLTRKVVNATVSSCSTSKSSMIRQQRRWLWSPCGGDSSSSW